MRRSPAAGDPGERNTRLDDLMEPLTLSQHAGCADMVADPSDLSVRHLPPQLLKALERVREGADVMPAYQLEVRRHQR